MFQNVHCALVVILCVCRGQNIFVRWGGICSQTATIKKVTKHMLQWIYLHQIQQQFTKVHCIYHYCYSLYHYHYCIIFTQTTLLIDNKGKVVVLWWGFSALGVSSQFLWYIYCLKVSIMTCNFHLEEHKLLFYRLLFLFMPWQC